MESQINKMCLPGDTKKGQRQGHLDAVDGPQVCSAVMGS
jgi:hypothetical protein